MPVLHDNSRDECIVALLLRSIEPNPGTAANKIENTAISIICPHSEQPRLVVRGTHL